MKTNIQNLEDVDKIIIAKKGGSIIFEGIKDRKQTNDPIVRWIQKIIVGYSILEKHYFILWNKSSFVSTKEEILTLVKETLKSKWFKDKNHIENLLNNQDLELTLPAFWKKDNVKHFSNIHIVAQIKGSSNQFWLETFCLEKGEMLSLEWINLKIEWIIKEFNKVDLIQKIASYTRKDKEKIKLAFRYIDDVLQVQSVLHNYNNPLHKSYLLKRLFEVEDEMKRGVECDNEKLQKVIKELNSKIEWRKLIKVIWYINFSNSNERQPIPFTTSEKEFTELGLKVPLSVNKYNSSTYIPSNLYRVLSFENDKFDLLAI